MKRHEREAVEMIRAMVGPHGCTVTTENGGKHLAIFVEAPSGQWHKFPVSSSPANVGNMLGNVRQQVTAWMESAGLGEHRGQSGARKQKRHTRVRSRIWRIQVAIEPDDGPARDPWAVLSGFRLNGAADRAG